MAAMAALDSANPRRVSPRRSLSRARARRLRSGADGPSQALRRLVEGQTLEVAEHHRQAEGPWQAIDLPVQGLGLLAVEEDPIGRRGGGGRRGLPREARFLGPLTAAEPEACALRRAHGDAVEPLTQQVGLAQRPGLFVQDEEDGLEGVLGLVPVAEELPADAQNHRPVAGDKRGESRLAGLIATGRDPLDQLPVGEPGRRTALEERPEITGQRCHRHVRPSRSRRRSRAGRIWPTLAACYLPPSTSHPLGTMLSGRPLYYPR